AVSLAARRFNGDKPPVAMDDAGDFVVVLTTDQGIFAEVFDASGALRHGPIALNAPFTFPGFASPAVAMDGAGDFAVAYEKFTTTGDNVFVQRFDANANPIGDPQQVSATPADRSINSISLAMDRGGHFLVAWDAVQDTVIIPPTPTPP